MEVGRNIYGNRDREREGGQDVEAETKTNREGYRETKVDKET